MKSIIKYLFLAFLFSYINNICQEEYGNISGNIIDFSTKKGLPECKYIFSKTTIGTTSDFNGMYYINKLPVGEYILVVSMIGYEPGVKKIEVEKGSNLSADFFLKLKPVELDSVEIIGDKSLYEQYLIEQYNYRKLFKKYFLGQTKFSEECIILNEEKINFEKDTLGFIRAKCREPIIVINKALGYKVECLLEHFSCNDIKQCVKMIFYPKFTEMEFSDENQKEDFKENREAAYLCSLRRFLLSIVNNDIQHQNYGLYLADNIIHIRDIPKPKLLYGMENISKVDSVTKEITVSFKGFLFVYNNRTKESSWIHLPFGEATLKQDGYLEEPLNMMVYYSFARQGIANFLPDNLQFDKKEIISNDR